MQSLISIIDAISQGRLTARAALERSFDTIAARENDILAFTALADRARALDGADNASGPLAGIAVGVKDIFDSHDLDTAYGSDIYAGHRPMADAAIVAMARRAGATIIGKTVTTEFAFFEPGPTRNPHSLDHSPGGSSSGSAAAVAAGMIPAAIGTQTGGSIIRPASFCGVAGYKPSFRLVPVTGMKTFSWSLDTTGLFAAGVADVAMLAALMTGRDLAVAPIEPARLRIGLYRTRVWTQASAAMQSAVENAAAAAEAAGAQVVEIDEPDVLAQARDVHSTIQDFEAGLAMAGDYDANADRMSNKLRQTLEAGRAIAPADYDGARKCARAARREATALFSSLDVILTPSAPGAAPLGHGTTGVPTFNKLWTLTGNPCVNVPGIKGEGGLPLGVQLVGRFGNDQITLSAAAWLERAL